MHDARNMFVDQIVLQEKLSENKTNVNMFKFSVLLYIFVILNE